MVARLSERTGRPPGEGRIRVLYVIDSLGHGGAERLLAAYLQHLPSLGVDPIVAALQERSGNPVAAELQAMGVPVVDLGIERLRQRGAYRRVAETIEQSRPDVVHTQLEFSNVLATAAAARRGIPVVSTLHTLDEPAPLSKAALRMRVMAWSLRRHADLVVAVSEHARRHHLEHLRLPAGLVSTIHNGIDVTSFAPHPDTRRDTREALGLPLDVPVLVTVAVLRPPKGIDGMLRALPSVLSRHPGARYLIVGDGPARAALEAVAAEEDVTAAVTFAGARADVADMLAAADLFVLPSMTEALPTVVAEAMAAGLPVVATDVGGTPEMIGPDNGILAAPGDPDALGEAVAGLLDEPGRATAMGAAGRDAAARHFDLPLQAALLAGEYRRLIGSRRR